MGLINTSNYGVCVRCGGSPQPCRKRAKELLCLFCCKSDDTKKQLANQKERNLKRRALVNDSAKVRKVGVDNLHHQYKNPIAEESQSLMDWFTNRMRDCEPQCENCKTLAPYLKEAFWKKQWKSCQAHLFAKRHFKSIATHPLNGMVLGTGYSGMCHCHDIYDAGYEKASKMKIWPEVIRRFQILYPLMRQEEYQYIPDVLQPYIPKSISAIGGNTVTVTLRRQDDPFVNSEINIVDTGSRADVIKSESINGEVTLTLRPQKIEDVEFEEVKPETKLLENKTEQ